jgi:putative ABC transport system substrate-binding protein
MRFDHLKRREVITLLGSTAAWPLAARAQRTAMPVIGYLSSGASGSYALPEFHQGLGQVGFAEGRNVLIEYSWADGQYDRLPALAAELVRRQVTVIAAVAGPSALAAKAATTAIPIVFSTALDPIDFGLGGTLSHPGGNVTGVTSLSLGVGPKRLELLHEMLPTAAVIALLLNPTAANAEVQVRDMQASARSLGIQLQVLRASLERDFDAAFAKLAELRAAGLVIGQDVFFGSRIKQLAALTVRHAIPAISANWDFVVAGGLISYPGNNNSEIARQFGLYIGRILKGEKPADLPIVQPTRFELIINLKTAKALGITVPPSLLTRADEAIE